MSIQHFIQNKWTQALVLVLLLSSCGGMSHSATTESATTTGTTTIDGSGTVELINGIPVPPEPDPVANNATLAGIDVNGNGVRDDVERKIAEISSQETFIEHIKLALIRQELYLKNISYKEMLHNEFCYTNQTENGISYEANLAISGFIYNTEARKLKEQEAINAMDGGGLIDTNCLEDEKWE